MFNPLSIAKVLYRLVRFIFFRRGLFIIINCFTLINNLRAKLNKKKGLVNIFVIQGPSQLMDCIGIIKYKNCKNNLFINLSNDNEIINLEMLDVCYKLLKYYKEDDVYNFLGFKKFFDEYILNFEWLCWVFQIKGFNNRTNIFVSREYQWINEFVPNIFNKRELIIYGDLGTCTNVVYGPVYGSNIAKMKLAYVIFRPYFLKLPPGTILEIPPLSILRGIIIEASKIFNINYKFLKDINKKLNIVMTSYLEDSTYLIKGVNEIDYYFDCLKKRSVSEKDFFVIKPHPREGKNQAQSLGEVIKNEGAGVFILSFRDRIPFELICHCFEGFLVYSFGSTSILSFAILGINCDIDRDFWEISKDYVNYNKFQGEETFKMYDFLIKKYYLLQDGFDSYPFPDHVLDYTNNGIRMLEVK